MSRKPEASAFESGTLRAYLRAVASCRRVTVEEERELAWRVQQQRDEEALRMLVESNLRFVVSCAKAYRGLGVPFLDLIHEGNLGLIEAAQRFDPSRNVKFVTYAVWWVRQAIMQALSEQVRAFSLPVKLSGVAARFGREVAALAADLDHAPTSREIAAGLDISVAAADALRHVCGDDVSLSDRVGGYEAGGPELADTLVQEGAPPVDAELLQQALLAQLGAALEELDRREREVVRLRFGLDGTDPQTLQEIGTRLRLSRERVRQIEARAMEKIRRSQLAHELRRYLN